MAGSHQNQLTLCDHLEAIADSLPHGVDRGMCAYAAKMLGPLLRDLHVREEGVVFAWTEERFGDDPLVLTTLELLKNEHFEDECFADELAEMLGRLGTADATEPGDSGLHAPRILHQSASACALRTAVLTQPSRRSLRLLTRDGARLVTCRKSRSLSTPPEPAADGEGRTALDLLGRISRALR